MRLVWLGEVLRGAGLEVIELDGWQQRGRDLASVGGIVLHHTGSGPNWDDRRVAYLLRDGRTDLPGPLAQLGLDRQGRFWLVAAGKANHAGFGRPWGNQSIGIEAYNDGRGEPWGERQVLAWQRGCAAVLRHLQLSTANVLGHLEVDPTRKVDPKGLDLGWFRGCVARMLNEEDADMEAQFVIALYAGYFGVSPGDPKWDNKGFDFWLRSLLAGMSKEKVRGEFAKAAKIG